MKTHVLALTLILSTTAAHAIPAEAPGPHTVPENQPACMNVADFDRIMLQVMDKKNALERESGYRAFVELRDIRTKATEGRICEVIRKGTKTVVEKRMGLYDCVRYKGVPPAYYQDTCSGRTASPQCRRTRQRRAWTGSISTEHTTQPKDRLGWRLCGNGLWRTQ